MRSKKRKPITEHKSCGGFSFSEGVKLWISVYYASFQLMSIRKLAPAGSTRGVLSFVLQNNAE